MSDAQADTGIKHARQLERVLGILDVMDADATGNEAVVVADVREAVENRAERIAYSVEPQSFASLDAAEFRKLAVFCDQLATRELLSDPIARKRARTLADVAAERVEEAMGDE